MDNERKTGWALALAGFIPFGAGAVAAFLPFGEAVSSAIGIALAAYAAVILSFLGGIRWGLALTGPGAGLMARDLALSVVPSLWAWAAFLAGGTTGLVMFAAGFAAMGIWDLGLAGNPRVPRWFVELRRVLSVLVTLALVAAALARVI